MFVISLYSCSIEVNLKLNIMKASDFNKLVTPKVSSKYGAPMGRHDVQDITDSDTIPKTTTRRIYLDSGGYDIGGAYWGLGNPLFVTYSKCGKVMNYFRD